MRSEAESSLLPPPPCFFLRLPPPQVMVNSHPNAVPKHVNNPLRLLLLMFRRDDCFSLWYSILSSLTGGSSVFHRSIFVFSPSVLFVFLADHSSNPEFPVIDIGIGYSPFAIAAATTDGEGPTSEQRDPFAFIIVPFGGCAHMNSASLSLYPCFL